MVQCFVFGNTVVKDKFIYTVLSKCMIFTVHNPLGYDTHRFIYAEKTAGPLCIIILTAKEC